MLDITDAVKKAKAVFPQDKIDAYIEYKNLFILRIFVVRPGETGMDPFFSFDRETGEFRDYAIFEHGNIDAITALFQNPKHVPQDGR